MLMTTKGGTLKWKSVYSETQNGWARPLNWTKTIKTWNQMTHFHLKEPETHPAANQRIIKQTTFNPIQKEWSESETAETLRICCTGGCCPLRSWGTTSQRSDSWSGGRKLLESLWHINFLWSQMIGRWLLVRSRQQQSEDVGQRSDICRQWIRILRCCRNSFLFLLTYHTSSICFSNKSK